MDDKAKRPSPLLLFLSKDEEKMCFSSIGDEKHHFVQTTPPELHGKEVQAYYHGWFILLDKENQQRWIWSLWYQEKRYSLWNPLTFESINLPPLTLKAKREIGFCILSSPPGNPDSMLILYETKDPSLIFFRIGIAIGYKQWIHQTIKLMLDKYDVLTNPVICNRTLYCHTFSRPKLVKIELGMPDFRLPLTLFEECIPSFGEDSIMFSNYMIESCGELFLIYLVKRASVDGQQSPLQVISVEVFGLDFSAMVWNKVESIKNRAFFVSVISSFSCPVTSLPESHIYFTLPMDKSLYSFNMDDKTVSVSLAGPNFPISCCSPIWIMADLRLTNILRQSKGDIQVERKEIQLPKNREIVKHGKLEQVDGDFVKLPLDVLFAIGKCLAPHDYLNFRSVNKRFRMSAPPIRWTSAALEGFEGYNFLLPWLMLCRKGDSICSFIDLWGAKYPLVIPNNQLKNVTRCYSREGWCLMLQGEHSIFLWNPFAEKIILLPDLPWEGRTIHCFGFSSSIDCVVLIGVTTYGYDCIDYIFLEEGRWNSLHASLDLFVLAGCSNLTFHDGAFYTFDKNGKLFTFKEGAFKFFDKPEQPCCFHQCYLVECDGKLLSVFVGFLGKWIRIFSLNESQMVWVEVKSLGSYTIYVSYYSSFAIPATHGMENRVYFPRFYGKNAVYYSLSSRKLHSHSTEEVLDSFNNTKEQLYSSWIQPKWS
ncbi:hypothetical protein SLEP1_g50681 [Rubroshorea leprosula]|uniref:KIB1-4 beta-propeller domain-containing protein n=1 Tax=Rubroshorea leprosula TaxID=152421 RepID=A0AAV5M378_9ROSI|nr:hypothetical protein SLEP1_g50681 [Rubroshorea leprosula]